MQTSYKNIALETCLNYNHFTKMFFHCTLFVKESRNTMFFVPFIIEPYTFFKVLKQHSYVLCFRCLRQSPQIADLQLFQNHLF